MTIALTDVSKIYIMGEVTVRALDGITLRIEEGEFAAIVGPSGSGKSTLMNIIGCLDRTSGGSYRLADQEVTVMDDDRLAEVRNRRIGFVFQSFNLLPRMSALQNVALPLVYAGADKRLRVERAARLLAMVGLENRKNHRPNELSGGQRQRVAIARALANDPAIIIADEPTGNLDTKASSEIMAIFGELNRQGRTIILVTHEPDIAAFARRVISIRDGKIVSDKSDQVVTQCSGKVS